MAKDKYGKAGTEGKTGNPSGYQEPKVVKNLYDFFQKMEAENKRSIAYATQSKEGPEAANFVLKRKFHSFCDNTKE